MKILVAIVVIAALIAVYRAFRPKDEYPKPNPNPGPLPAEKEKKEKD